MANLVRTTREAHLQSFRRRNFVVWSPIWFDPLVVKRTMPMSPFYTTCGFSYHVPVV